MLGMLGAIFGSFIAALVVRWPQGRSVITGRSACDGCERTLTPVELVPILSALWLRGRCRTCGARIDPVHWQVELAAAGIGAASGLLLPGAAGAASAVFGWLLLALAVIDARHFWLPDRLTLVLALGGIAVGVMGIGPGLTDRLIGGAAGFAVLWSIGASYKALRGREGLGGGDPKLLGAIGLWVGWRLLPIVVVLASMAGLGVVLFWLLTGRGAARDDRLPFGTLLAIGAYPLWVGMIMTGV
jgi:leader peptidase (prepilin peptidase)/N-methyltransferase